MRREALWLLITWLACRAPEQPRASTEAPHADEHEDSGRVTLSEAAFASAEIRVVEVRSDGGTGAGTLEVPGEVQFDPRRVALISARQTARIEVLSAVEGDRVRAGDTLAMMFSQAFLTAQSDLQQASARARAVRGSTGDTTAEAIARAARRRLEIQGAGPAEIERLESGGEPRPFLALLAPFAGSVMEAHALTGASVEPGAPLFRLADLSVVDVVAQVPERAIPLVRLDQPATITIAAYPNLRFSGRVERLKDELDAETRTVGAVIHAPNPTGRLRPGMFATVQFAMPGTPVGGRPAPPTIPSRAVVTDGGRQFVFVEIGPRTFERREVETSSMTPPGSVVPSADHVLVRRGVVAGDRVVVEGAFTLKSELAKAALGEHGH